MPIEEIIDKLKWIAKHSIHKVGEPPYCMSIDEGVAVLEAVEILARQIGQGWISVEDRLPEDEGDVLVYGVSPRGRKKVAIMNYLTYEADRPRWALDSIWTVLYWMPLPELPKEETP